MASPTPRADAFFAKPCSHELAGAAYRCSQCVEDAFAAVEKEAWSRVDKALDLSLVPPSQRGIYRQIRKQILGDRNGR